MNNIIEKQWKQPTLTTNGTLGGNAFAVSCKDFASNNSSTTDCDAWYAFASDETKYWRSKTSTSYLIFYNPVPLKINKIYVRTAIGTSVTYGAPESGTIYGSNDGSTWVAIKKFTNTTTGAFTILVESAAFYKYHKFEATCTKNDTYIHAHFRIDAVYQQVVSGITATLSKNTETIKKTDITELTNAASEINMATGSKTTYTQPTTTETILKVNYQNLRAAIVNMQKAFNNNCCQSNSNDCCEGCQACQACQTCQTSSCQSQTCQTSSCQSCQGCQTQSCQSKSQCSQCTNCTNCSGCESH